MAIGPIEDLRFELRPVEGSVVGIGVTGGAELPVPRKMRVDLAQRLVVGIAAMATGAGRLTMGTREGVVGPKVMIKAGRLESAEIPRAMTTCTTLGTGEILEALRFVEGALVDVFVTALTCRRIPWMQFRDESQSASMDIRFRGPCMT